MATVRSRLELEGGRLVKQAIEGTARTAEQAERRSRRESKRTADASKKDARDRTRAAEDSARKRLRAEERLGDAKRRIEKRATREMEGELRERERAERRSARRRRSFAATAARGLAAGLGVGQQVLGRARSAAGALGARSRDQLLTDEAAFLEQLVGLAGRRGLDGQQTRALRGRVDEISLETGLDQTTVLGGLEQAQSRFADQFENFEQLFPDIARAARATGSELSDMVTVLGNIGRANPEMSLEQLREALFLMVSMGNQGSVEAPQFAQAFGTIAGTFSAETQRRGPEAVREMLQVAQIMATSGASDSESATRFERILQRLNDVGVQRRARRLGVDVTTTGEEGGPLRDLMEITRELMAAGVNNPAQMQRLLGADKESRSALQTMMNAATNEGFQSGIAGASGEDGMAFVQGQLDRLEASGVQRMRRVRIRQQADFGRQGGLQSDFADAFVSTAESVTRFETANLQAAEALDLFGSSVQSAVGSLAAMNLATGGGGGGVLGGAGAGAGAGAAAGGTAGVLGAGAAGAAAGFAVSETLTGSDSPFARGAGSFLRQIKDRRARGDMEGASRLARRGIDALQGEGGGAAGGIMQALGALTGLDATLNRLERSISNSETRIAPSSVRSIGEEVSRGVAGEARRQPGGPARRGG